jgi:hypothetical protein
LRRSLALAKDHHRHAAAQGAMVVQLSESEIFEWQMANAVYSFVGRKPAPADFIEKFADGFGVHSSTQPLAISIQPTRV